jgi:nitrite reductase/ring-hydroxylating ferredoxin subunit
MILAGAELEEEGNKIVLAMVNGQVFAIDAVCFHKGAPLEQGKLEGYNLTCPWHHAVFDAYAGEESTFNRHLPELSLMLNLC